VRLSRALLISAAVLAVGLAIMPAAAAAAPTAPISTWTQASPATSPPARFSASMAYDSATGQVVLFGGSEDGAPFGETWTYDGTTWTEQHPATSPPAREDATMAYDAASGQMILFGGREGEEALGETWTWDGTTWTQLPTTNGPPARFNASMAYDPATSQVVLFGGAGEGSRSETWTWDGTEWTKQHPATIPPGGVAASMAYDPATGQMIIFGGSVGGPSILDATWTWDGTEWMKQHPATIPPGREAASMAYDPALGQVVLFAGYGGGGGGAGALGDTWTWDGSEWIQQSPATSPPARYLASMAYDSATGQIVLFGGVSEVAYLSDTWTYHAIGPPSATISSPSTGGAYTVGTSVPTSFECQEAMDGPGIESCEDSGGAKAGPSGRGAGELDTGSVGPHTYTVTAVSKDGEEGEASITYTVVKATPTVTSTASEPVELGGSVHDTATIADGHSPGGEITFAAYGPGEPSTCSAAPAWTSEIVPASVNGNYESPPFTPTEAGTYTFVAVYSGNGENETASSSCAEPAASVTVGKASTTTSLSVGPDPATAGSAVTLTATVESVMPGGTVTFTDGSTVVGHATVGSGGTASLVTASLAVGAHQLTAEYEGDADDLPSSSPAVAETIVDAPPVQTPPPGPPVVTAPPAPLAPTPPAPPAKVHFGYSPNSAHGPDPQGGPRWTFRFGGGETGVRYECRLDGGSWGRCTSPKVYRHLKPGRHVFEVRTVTTDGQKSPVQKVAFRAGGKRHRR
jgi:hypothetical protein